MAIAAFGRDTFIRVLKAASAATADASSSAGMGGGRASVVRTGNCSEEGRGFPKKPDWPSSCRWAVNQLYTGPHFSGFKPVSTMSSSLFF